MIWYARTLAFAMALGLATNAVAKPPLEFKEPTCGEFGTSVHFEESPADAAKKALKAEKLVLVLHVSGHFEDPRFT